MNCDFFVFLLLGFTGKDTDRDDTLENLPDILKEVANICKETADRAKASLLNASQKHISSVYHNDNIFGTLGAKNRLRQKPKAGIDNRLNQFREMPVVTGLADLKQVVDNDVLSNTMLKIPESTISNLLTPDQLSLLYRNKQAFDIPVDDPSAPRLIAMTGRILNSIIRGKNRFHNVVNQGVAGAENLYSGIHEAAGGITELIGGGAHGLLDLFV